MISTTIKVVLDEINREILTCLYKVDFFCDYHLAGLIGENKEYIKGRLKKLARAGLIKRKIIKGNMPCVNWITKQGIKELGLEMRNVREPTTGRFEHSLGCADMYVYMTLMRKKKDGSYKRIVSFGEIITERDFNAVRELKQVKKKSNGQPVYLSLDSHIHKPDGYYFKNGKRIALEFERTPKSKAKILRNNVYENRKRFNTQIWVYDKPIVKKMLERLKQELGSEIQIISIETVREQIYRYVNSLPAEISKKSGKARSSAVGELVKPIPLNRLPIIVKHSAVPVLETRYENGSVLPKKILLERRD